MTGSPASIVLGHEDKKTGLVGAGRTRLVWESVPRVIVRNCMSKLTKSYRAGTFSEAWVPMYTIRSLNLTRQVNAAVSSLSLSTHAGLASLPQARVSNASQHTVWISCVSPPLPLPHGMRKRLPDR
jgi:hypothetical protein